VAGVGHFAQFAGLSQENAVSMLERASMQMLSDSTMSVDTLDTGDNMAKADRFATLFKGLLGPALRVVKKRKTPKKKKQVPLLPIKKKKTVP